jgi:AraC family transcriptional regulator
MNTSLDAKIHIYAWPDRFLYLGPSTKTSLHRNHAATWLVATQGTLQINLSAGEAIENEVIFVPSETEFATTKADANIAALYWEPESDSFQRATRGLDTTSARGFKCQYGLNELARLRDDETTLAEADQLLAPLFGLNSLTSSATVFQDARIIEALKFLRESPHAYDSLDALANRVHLSSSRFQHLFKEKVGVPVRRYVLWLKMRRALDLAMAGDSLTTAALSAGFADSAHLSRTVRAIMGVAPQFLFRNRAQLVVHA